MVNVFEVVVICVKPGWRALNAFILVLSGPCSRRRHLNPDYPLLNVRLPGHFMVPMIHVR